MNQKITFVQFSEDILSEQRVEDTSAFLTPLFTASIYRDSIPFHFFVFNFYLFMECCLFFMVVSWLCFSVAARRRRGLFGYRLQLTV